ncbi:MAG: hypothetical protein A3J83_05345 [Elusimicrobia bacterium RIFOXYA2_FULL_40_6]|nr:MAG: hypothetical protein A3J83_05345 [Elusimicrobia bacterium RIFOXYA2_FULL_40_6]
MIDIGNVNFYVKDVIDSRLNKDFIGIIKEEQFGVEIGINFEKRLRDSFLGYFLKSFPKESNKVPLILDIKEFKIKENNEHPKRKAVVESKIVFCIMKNGELINLYEADLHNETNIDGSSIEAHEFNIKKILRDSLFSLISSSTDVFHTGESVFLSDDDFSWTKTDEICVNYGVFSEGVLMKYRVENTNENYYRHKYSYNVDLGYYSVTNKDIEVKYYPDYIKTGKLSLNAITTSFCLQRYFKAGALKGKVGAGITGFLYNGSIDMSPFDFTYRGTSFDFNFDIPVEIVFSKNKTNGNMFKMNFDLLIPLSKNRFYSENDVIEGYLFRDIFLGFSIGRTLE